MTTISTANPLVDRKAAAKALGLSVDWLDRDRRGNKTLPFYRLPSGAVRYSLERCGQALQAHEQGGQPAVTAL